MINHSLFRLSKTSSSRSFIIKGIDGNVRNVKQMIFMGLIDGSVIRVVDISNTRILIEYNNKYLSIHNTLAKKILVEPHENPVTPSAPYVKEKMLDNVSLSY